MPRSVKDRRYKCCHDEQKLKKVVYLLIQTIRKQEASRLYRRYKKWDVVHVLVADAAPAKSQAAAKATAVVAQEAAIV
ncbi:hypothetical protein [Pontibacter amylolyticus]|uniref:Uncharacterized protein n=1 Tax=Pontibacter amylolyticus TaxID=1424080 RepID=A0ABQ1W8F1_9BACT|nr:hypothetical protein [Pontibacter amylolyticus]GGG17930.1 hypothetical protein GCM10011323_22720 [Pontibacter amylolyticus]